MGVTGSGKTTIGTLLAGRTGAEFADADDYHPLANKQKMAAGHPLNDEDRQPWLEELNRLLQGWFSAGRSGVLAFGWRWGLERPSQLLPLTLGHFRAKLRHRVGWG